MLPATSRRPRRGAPFDQPAPHRGRVVAQVLAHPERLRAGAVVTPLVQRGDRHGQERRDVLLRPEPVAVLRQPGSGRAETAAVGGGASEPPWLWSVRNCGSTPFPARRGSGLRYARQGQAAARSLSRALTRSAAAYESHLRDARLAIAPAIGS